MPEFTSPHGISYPIPGEFIKDGNFESKLTNDFKALAETAGLAITAESVRAVGEAIADAEDKYGKVNVTMLLGTENLQTIADGLYVPFNPQVAEDLGLPNFNYGLVNKTTQGDAGSSMTWVPWNSGEGGAEFWINRRFGASSWRGWERIGVNMRILAGAEQVGDLRDGDYMPLSGSIAVGIGLPSRNVGPLFVRSLRGGAKSFEWTVIDSDIRTYRAYKFSPTATMSKWDEFRPTSAPSGHWMRENELRRIYDVPVLNGAIPVSVIFDHGANTFKSSILPALTTNGLEATLALNSDGLNPANRQYPENDQTTWAEIDGWPVEKANHGHLHDDFTTPGEILNNIKNGLSNLVANLPNSPILSWVQTGNGTDSWYGFNDGRTMESYIDTPVGQYILEHHACSTGLIGGGVDFPYYTMDGTIKQGVHGFWIDSPAGITAAKAHIETAITQRKGVVIRCHPGELGKTGKSTVAEVVAFLAWLGAQQASGAVKTLSLAQWNLANLVVDDARPAIQFKIDTDGVPYF